MSNATRKTKKAIQNAEYIEQQLLDTPYGSLIATTMILNPKLALSTEEFIKRMEKCYFPYINDPDYIKKVVDEFFGDNTYESCVVGQPIAMVQSKWNVLFVPYILGENDEVLRVTVRRDGTRPMTLDNGKLILINWEGDKKDEGVSR